MVLISFEIHLQDFRELALQDVLELTILYTNDNQIKYDYILY